MPQNQSLPSGSSQENSQENNQCNYYYLDSSGFIQVASASSIYKAFQKILAERE